jgi:hypothetical protein
MQAAAWFETYWTGEFGNYTNATAGYVGFDKASGIEGYWRCTRRDTIGNSGTNKQVSLNVFMPNLVLYI